MGRGWPPSASITQIAGGPPVLARQKATDLRTLTQLAGSGTLTPVIGRTYPLAAAADAIRDIAAGHTTGKGVITI